MLGSMATPLGTWIRLQREARGLSQEALAHLLHTSQGHVTRLERGTRLPGAPLLRGLARVFAVDLALVYRLAYPDRADPPPDPVADPPAYLAALAPRLTPADWVLLVSLADHLAAKNDP